MNTATVADRIRARLDILNKNASSVALEAGLSRSSVLDILKGKAANPRLDTLKKLTGPLECSLAYLTGDLEDPTPGRLSVEEYALLDTDVRDEALILAAGVYRERGAMFTRKVAPTLSYRDPRFPKLPVILAVMGDDSLAGAGILEGDQITYVADAFGELDLPLSNNAIAIVRRDLGDDATEYSARRVVIVDGSVFLITQPGSGDGLRIPIVAHQYGDDETDYLRNRYAAGNDKSLTIEGLAIRITRTMPDPFDGNFTQTD